MGGTTKVLPKLRTCCLKYFGNQPLKPRGMHEAKTQRSSLFECSLYYKSINIRVQGRGPVGKVGDTNIIEENSTQKIIHSPTTIAQGSKL